MVFPGAAAEEEAWWPAGSHTTMHKTLLGLGHSIKEGNKQQLLSRKANEVFPLTPSVMSLAIQTVLLKL